MEKLLAFKKWGFYGLVLCLSLLTNTQVHAQCPAEAGAIEITGTGATSADICAGDGVGDPIDVTVTGAPVGTNSGWVITDNATGTILALPPAPPFDLDGAGAGVCDIWYIRYEAGLTGLMTGENVADLAGCFDLSNAISVNRFQPEAGDISITGSGATEIDICAGDGTGDPIDVTVAAGSVGANSGWVITDNTTGEILALPPAPPFDLDGAGAGVCDIWYIRYDGALTGLTTGANVADLDGCFDLSNAITVNRFQPEAGDISITGSGATEIDICAGDGTGDPIDVTVAAGSVGANSGWVITDNTTGEILALPPAPPFDLDGAGAGVCDIWYIRYDGALTGLATGENVADLDGCFDLSNAITVNRFQPEAGDISITGSGATEIDICAGDGTGDPIDVTVAAGSVGANSGWVITDNTTGEILALPPAPPFDLDGAGAGVCDIWYIRYDGALTGLATGENVADLDGCFDLSNAITVNRFQPEAGDISITGSGATEIDICAGDGTGDPIDVTVAAGSVGANSGWVITDNTTGEILALPPAPPFDLDGAGAGVCDIWYIRYDGALTGLATGENVADLDGCFDLSNAITVNRFQPEAGDISITGSGATEIDICAGDGTGDPIDVTVAAGSVGANSGWVITDNTTGEILALPPAPPFDLDGAGAGVCDIWYIRYDGALTGLATGENVADLDGCFDLSNAITVNRFQPEAGDISITGSGATEIDICAGDGTGDPIDVTVAAGSVGANSGWVITDNTTGEILALPPAPPFDLDGAGAGVCDIWYIRYDGALTGLATGANVADLDGCFDLSNAITVNRFQPEAGDISITGSGATEIDICAGDGTGDPIDVTVAAGSVGANSGWVITDNTTGEILALPPAPPFDLDGAGAGVCDIWYIRYDGALTGLATGENVADLDGCFDLSNPITVNRFQPEAGAISITGSGTTVIGICAGDGQADPIDVTVEPGSMGPESGWIITDNATGTILALPAGPPFDLDGAGAGICDIWYIRYGGTLNGLETGANVADLDGCFDLSNPISVNRFQPEAGSIAVAGTGETEVLICVDGVGDPLDIEVTGGGQGLFSAWVITDTNTGTILALPPGPPFDLDGAGPGVCDIWYLRYDSSLFNLEVGENVDDLIGCFDLSNPVSVIRQEAEAGTLALPDGSTAVSICAGDGTGDPLEVIAQGQSPDLNFRYVITDNSADSTILAISDTNIIDLEGAGEGICLIWGWSYTGLNPDDFIGQPAANLELEDCSDLSEGFIEVTRLTGDDCEVLALEDQAVLTFEMAPNPASDFVEIRLAQTSQLEVVVYDLAGRQLRVEQFDDAQRARLDVNGLPTGTYLLRMVDRATGSTATSRLIKR